MRSEELQNSCENEDLRKKVCYVKNKNTNIHKIQERKMKTNNTKLEKKTENDR